MAQSLTPLPVRFGGGVDTDTEQKQIPITQLIDLQNAVFDKAATLKKRNGYESLSKHIQNAAGDITNARGLARRDDEVLLFTDARCYSHRPSSDEWADTGEVAVTSATTIPIARTGTFQSCPDIAERNGIRVVAWEDSRGGVWCSVVEADTGRVLRSQTQLDSSTNARNIRCLAVGEVLHVLWTRADLGFIQIAIINPAMPTASPPVSVLVSDLDTARAFYDAEAAPFAPAGGSIRPGLIAWAAATSPARDIRVGYISPAGTIGSPLTGLPSVVNISAALFTGAMAISHDPRSGLVGLAAVAPFGPSRMVVTVYLDDSSFATLSTFSSPSIIEDYSRIAFSWGGELPSGTIGSWWIAERAATASSLAVLDSAKLDVIAGVPTHGAVTSLRGHNLVSRAFRDGGVTSPGGSNGEVYAFIAHTVRFKPYIACIRLSAASGIASPTNVITSRLMPGEAAGLNMRSIGAGVRQWSQHLPSVMSVGLSNADMFTREHAVCAPYRIALSSTNADQFSEQGIKLCTIRCDASYRAVQFGRGLILSSSAPQHYDGDGWHEADFHAGPDLGFDTAGAPIALTTQAANGGAGAIPLGTYIYAAWYEVPDAQGEIHRSGVSVKFLFVVSGAPSKVTLTFPTCRLTRYTNARVCVARSEAGATGTNQNIPLYRITNVDPTVTTGDNRFVFNDTTVDTVSVTDNLTDAVLRTQEPLYTNGGVLSNDASPWSGEIVAAGKNRVFWTDTSDGRIVRFSKLRNDDTGIESAPALALRVDQAGGPVTAIAIMDDAVYPLCETAIFIFSGPGPDDTNGVLSQDAFSPTEIVTTDAGCSSTGSVCDAPIGILFQSRKGIVLLGRDRQLRDVGARVSGYDTQSYTRMTLLPDRQSIIALTASGRTLLWDYRRDQWSTFMNHEGLDAVVVGERYHYLRNDSRVFRETPGVYSDDGQQIPMVIETAWIHFAEYLQGWQRIVWTMFLGERKSAHSLRVRFRLDYDAAYSSPIDIPTESNWNPSLYGGGSYGVGSYGGPGLDGTRYQRTLHMPRRCQAISFQLSDIEATGVTGPSFELSELLLLGAVISSRIPTGAKRAGIAGGS